MGMTAQQGYRDGMTRDLPEPVCTHDYYVAMRAALRERLWECQRKIEEVKG